jgi:peptidyl-prolyl cis-trans isomerase A (cyclophilin A)
MRTSLSITLFAAGALALAGSLWAAQPAKAQTAAAVPATFTVNFDTTKGPVVVQVHRDWAPIGADHFAELVKSGYFDGCRFFRVVPGFVVQFGLAADPAVTRKWKAPSLRDDPVKQHNVRGTLVYATAGPNTRTTQLFINLGDNSRLDADGFAPFGVVTKGMGAVDAIFPGYGEAPQQPLIESQGNGYLEPKFPKLDYVRKATIQ